MKKERFKRTFLLSKQNSKKSIQSLKNHSCTKIIVSAQEVQRISKRFMSTKKETKKTHDSYIGAFLNHYRLFSGSNGLSLMENCMGGGKRMIHASLKQIRRSSSEICRKLFWIWFHWSTQANQMISSMMLFSCKRYTLASHQ